MSGLGLNTGRSPRAKISSILLGKSLVSQGHCFQSPLTYRGQVNSGRNRHQLTHGHRRTCIPVCVALHISHYLSINVWLISSSPFYRWGSRKPDWLKLYTCWNGKSLVVLGRKAAWNPQWEQELWRQTLHPGSSTARVCDLRWSLDSPKRSNRSILKEISPDCSLEGLMLKLKLQYFGHLMRRADSGSW